MNRPAYKEWAPAPVLARHLDCLWLARAADDGAAHTERVLPDGCVDVIWDGASVFVAGPDTGPVPFRPVLGAVFAGARFRPGLAPTLLGLPSDALRDQRVPLEEVWDTAVVARLAYELQAELGLPLEEEDGYYGTQKIDGVKHLGLWPLEQAAQSCFGAEAWPADVPVPQATIEFEVDDVAEAPRGPDRRPELHALAPGSPALDPAGAGDSWNLGALCAPRPRLSAPRKSQRALMSWALPQRR
jgi:hypothetical protein